MSEPGYEATEYESTEYEVVKSPINRGGTAILLFPLLYFGGRYIYFLTGESFRTTVAIITGLLVVGLLLAVAGLRRDTHKLPALLGLLLHCGGLLTITASTAGFYLVLLWP